MIESNGCMHHCHGTWGGGGVHAFIGALAGRSLQLTRQIKKKKKKSISCMSFY